MFVVLGMSADQEPFAGGGHNRGFDCLCADARSLLVRFDFAETRKVGVLEIQFERHGIVSFYAGSKLKGGVGGE